MRTLFLLSIFSLFLLSIIKNQQCIIKTSLEVDKTGMTSPKDISVIWDSIGYVDYVVNIEVKFPIIVEYDLITFEIVNSHLADTNISFFLKDTDDKAFDSNIQFIELKVSDVTSGTYFLKLFVYNDRRKSDIKLKYNFSHYSDKKRLRDNDNYSLEPGDKELLIYEYGLSENKMIFFTALGISIKDFKVNYEIDNKNNTMSKNFLNGYSLIITKDCFQNKNKTIKFYFEDNDEKLNITTSLKDDIEKNINITNNHFDIIILVQSENYKINLNIKDSEKYIFKFTTYAKDVKAIFGKDNYRYQFEINEESSYNVLDSVYKNYNKVIFQNIGNKENTTLSFDVFQLGNNFYNIIRGLPQRNILYSNMTAFYKPYSYSNKSEIVVINSHIIKGHPNFYIYTDTNDNNSKIPDINGFISFKYTINTEKPTYAKVECPSEECIFDIDMKGIEEFTYLIKDYKMFSFLEKSIIDKYQINVNNVDNNNYLLINIHYPIQAPNVSIDNLKKDLNEYKIKLIENVISYNIPITDVDRKKSDIFINITTNNPEGIFYGINYEIKTQSNYEINLENGIAYYMDSKNNINSKKFIIRRNTDSKLVINVNTFGNDLELTINSSKYTPKNNLIYIELNKTLDEYFSLSIKNNTPYSEQYINLFIYEPQYSKIFIQEGVLYNNKLTEDNNEINYSLYLNKSRKYILNFRKYSTRNVKITINNKTFIISKFTELININQTFCSEEICENLIKIKKESREKELDFSFLIINKNEKIYLIKNILFYGILENNNIIVYKGTYENNDELFVDFLEGQGHAILRVIESESIRNYEMDYYNKRFNLNRYNCNNNCKFELELKLNDTAINKIKYNILLKDATSLISVPAFETIYGILKNSNEEHKYSIKKFGKYYNYELDCNFCEITNNQIIEDEIKFNIKLNPPQKINFEVYYNLRINLHDNESIILYHLDSVRNHHFCEINVTKPCYYLSYIEGYGYYDIKNLQFLVQNIQNVDINLKIFDEKKTEEQIYSLIEENNIGDFDKSTKDSDLKNYLKIEFGCNGGCYALLKINSTKINNMKVNLVYDIFRRSDSSMEYIYKDDFCLINSNKIIELINIKEEYYILDINLLNGTEKIIINTQENINENKEFYLKKGFKESLNLFLSSDKNYTIHLNQIQNFESIIYYRKIKSKNNKAIKEINFGKSNYLIYEKKDEIEYKSFYINLNDVVKNNEDIHLNYKFLKNSEQNYPEEINLEILLVDENYILNEKEGLNNDNLIYDNIGDIIYYQKDMGAGYSLIYKESIEEKSNSYIYIRFNNKKEKELVITLTDFSANYDIPTCIYLIMFIKNETKLELNQKNNIPSRTPFLELSHDSHLFVDHKGESINNRFFNGKTFFKLKNGGTYEFIFKNNDYKLGKMPNLLLKRGFSSYQNFSDFKLNSNKIKYKEYNDSYKAISFNAIKSIDNTLSYSVIYNILIYDKNISCDSILEKIKPIASKIYIEKDLSKEIISLNISKELCEKFGKYYINILAEAKNEEENTYEYLLYNFSDIYVTVNTIETNIKIEEIENSNDFNYTLNVKIKANISINKDTSEYKFIKLILIDEKYERQKFEIYASTKESLLDEKEKTSLYERSEYKSIDSYNNTVLAIPLEKCNDSQLYIYIRNRKREVLNFKLIYRIEDGRKMEGISIHENTCYDILLKSNAETESKLNYRFVYTITKTYYPLITFTTYEINNDYELFTTGLENEFLKKYFYNGDAFLIIYTDSYFEYHTFILRPHVTTVFRICHKIIPKNEETITRPISIGENIYSVLWNKIGLLSECFEIEEEERGYYDKYMFNYISKSQNMKLEIFNGNGNEKHNLFNESGNLFFEASKSTKFCLSLRDEIKGSITDNFGSINFQILGVKDKINHKQNIIIVPLINGYSMRHYLEPGQMIYYRLNKYKINSQFLELYFQNLKGEPSIKKFKCNNYPSCSFSPLFEEAQNIEDYFHQKYLYDSTPINGIDAYNKANFLVYSVSCDKNSNKDNDNCMYYIGMHNENSSLALNENRKIYFQLNKTKTFYFSTEFYSGEYISKNEEEIEDVSCKYYLEIHLLKGYLETSKVYINGENIALHNFDKKTYYYSTVPYDSFSNVGFYSFVNKLELDEDIFFYITYRILLFKNNGAKKTDDFYNMYSIYEEEMHYNILTPSKEIFSYFYPEIYFENNTPNETYIVSISSINSYISVDGSNNYKKYHQFLLKKNVTEINCQIENSENSYRRQCEYIFSFANLREDSIYKKVEFDGFYQYYEINDTIKNVFLYYSLTEEELTEEQILITINKDNQLNLKIEYGYNTNNTLKDFMSLSYPLSTNKSNEVFRIDLQNLMHKLENHSAQYLMFKLTSEEDNISFKIKINIKNNPTYLYSDEIEFGSVKKNEILYYYFDYVTRENFETPEDLEEIYLYSKGMVGMEVATIKNEEHFPYNPNDMYVIVFDDSKYKCIENNHIYLTNIKEEGYDLGLRVYIKVFLNNSENINEDNFVSFSICRHSQKEKGLFSELNTNIFGNIYFSKLENYHFYTNITKIKGKIKINLVCKNCILSFCDKFYEEEFFGTNTSGIFMEKYLGTEDKIVYFKLSGENGYYFFSLSEPNKPKYIEESLPELCQHSCKFVFPLYNFSNYTTNDENKITIVFFSPDDKRVKIKGEISNKSDMEDIPLSDFNITDNKSIFNNILIFTKKVSEIKSNEKYLKIHATLGDINQNQFFTIIMNKFINSKNIDPINPPNQIITVHKKEKPITINNLDDYYFYKINLKVISGEGKVILSGGKIYSFDLNYEYCESISLILKFKNHSIKAQNSKDDDDFIFFINVTKLGNYEDIKIQLENQQQNYRIKYIIDDDEKSDIFPLNLKINCKKGHTTFLSYRFIQLEKRVAENDTKNDLVQITTSGFSAHFAHYNENITLESIYYPDFKRGVIILDNNETNNETNNDNNYIDLVLDKSDNKEDTYETLFLETGLVYINNSLKEREKIDIPKDVYVQLDLNTTNKIYELIFFEPNTKYNHFQIELANTTYVEILNERNDCFSKEYHGKFTCKYPIDNTREKSISLKPNTSVTIFVKYTTKKDESDFPNFSLENRTIEKEDPENNKTSYNLTQDNIKPESNPENIPYELSYFIRLYNYLKFNNDTEIDSIIVRANGNMTFRMDCNDTKAEQNQINYFVNFTDKIPNETYFISVIGQAKFKNSVEYFSYLPIKIRLTNIAPSYFEKNWIIPLVFVLLMFCAIAGYIIYVNIKEYKQKKNKKKEGVADILINEEENEVKRLVDIKEKDKDKEDNDDEEDNEVEDNDESLIKI